ncbi:hypothetical protein E6O75_ATG06147 [Venturia nashicola]|uniref:Uncharacterized protein n=1 Tax=Venturia nashicola TaxID=86259 RepID=A0A4Z1NTE2_9PEZI|nr:hypothetical protein E6O75_ATG06147 [Venturia nashicola]
MRVQFAMVNTTRKLLSVLFRNTIRASIGRVGDFPPAAMVQHVDEAARNDFEAGRNDFEAGGMILKQEE